MGSRFIGLRKIDASGEKAVVSKVPIGEKGLELRATPRDDSREGVKRVEGRAGVRGLPNPSAREWGKSLGREVEGKKDGDGTTGGPEGRDFNDRGPKNSASGARSENGKIDAPVNPFDLVPSTISCFFGKSKVVPEGEDIGGPLRRDPNGRDASSGVPWLLEREGSTRESLMKGNMIGVDLILRLLIARESRKTPIPELGDLLKTRRIEMDEPRKTWDPGIGPNFRSSSEGSRVGVEVRARMGGLANTHPREPGPPEPVIGGEIAIMVVMRENTPRRKS